MSSSPSLASPSRAPAAPVSTSSASDEKLEAAATTIFLSSLPYIKKTQKIYRGIVGRNRKICKDIKSTGNLISATAREVARCTRESETFDVQLAGALDLSPPKKQAVVVEGLQGALDGAYASLQEVCELATKIEDKIDAVLEERRAK